MTGLNVLNTFGSLFMTIHNPRSSTSTDGARVTKDIVEDPPRVLLPVGRVHRCWRAPTDRLWCPFAFDTRKRFPLRPSMTTRVMYSYRATATGPVWAYVVNVSSTRVYTWYGNVPFPVRFKTSVLRRRWPVVDRFWTVGKTRCSR